MRPYLGAHVSAAGGHHKAIERARELEANTIQIFGASPRQWKAGVPSLQDIQKYRKALENSEVKSVYLHAAYLVNLAGSGELYQKSIDNLALHLEIARALGADGLIFHIGSSREKNIRKVREQIVKGMTEVLSRVKDWENRVHLE